MITLMNVPRALLETDTEEGVLAFLAKHYPPLASSGPPDPRHYEGPTVPVVQHSVHGVNLHRSMALPQGMDFETFRDSASVEHHGRWAIPSLGGASGVTAPLVLWWALLFGLSMRARYEAEGWTRDLDVDHSPIAVTLEEVLELALQVCPMLVSDAITAVADQS